MIRTTRLVKEIQCANCGLVYLLGQKLDGDTCCEYPKPMFIGDREIVEYKKTIEEEKAEVIRDMNR